MSDHLDFLRHLHALDVAIFTAAPGTVDEYVGRPDDWTHLSPAGNAARIKAHRPGHALEGLMGGRVVGIDVDTRNGGDPDKVRALLDALHVTVYADVMTPGGGRHFYIAGHPDLPTVHASEGRDGLEGYPGVEVISYGANLYLPGTQRPKYDGGGYVVLLDNLEALADGGDPLGAETFAGWVAEHRTHNAEPFTPSPPWDGAPPDRRQAAYLAKVLSTQCTELAAMGPDSGRNNKLYTAGLKCGNYVAGAGMDEPQAIAQLTAAADSCGLTRDDGPLSVQASIRSGLRNGRARPRAVPPPKELHDLEQIPAGVDPATGEVLDNHRGDITTVEVVEPLSWSPVDLAGYLDGTHVPDVPTLLVRTDGVCLLYPGLVHSLHGESESGKSLVAQYLSAQQIKAGRPVLFIDFESDAATVTERLLMFGATPAQILAHFTYIHPENDPRNVGAEMPAWFKMLAGSYVLVVIDGVTDSLGIFGYASKDNDDVAAWMRVLPKNIAKRTGAAVAVIDHVTKDNDTRGRFAIGAQAKMSGLTGAGYTVEVVEPLGRGLRGVIVLRVGKDRPGHVRGVSGPMRKSDRTQESARVVVDSTADPDHPAVTVEPWRGSDGLGLDARPFRPTGLMQKVSEALELADEPLTTNGVTDRVTGNYKATILAVDLLVSEGYVARQDGPNRSRLHTLVSPYRQRVDPLSDLYSEAGGTQYPNPGASASHPYTGGWEAPTQVPPEAHKEAPGGTQDLGLCPDCAGPLDQPPEGPCSAILAHGQQVV